MTYPEGRKERSFRPFSSPGWARIPYLRRCGPWSALRGAEPKDLSKETQGSAERGRAAERGSGRRVGAGVDGGRLPNLPSSSARRTGERACLRERGNFRRKFPKISRFPARPARVRWSAQRSCVRTLSRQAAPLLRASAVSPASCGAAFSARVRALPRRRKKADPVAGSAMMVKRMSSAFLPRLAEGSGVSSAPRPSRALFPDPAARRSCAVRSRGEDP